MPSTGSHSMHVNVSLAYGLANPETLRGSVAIVIDIIRATTTITAALASGATAVIPVEEIEQARELACKFDEGRVLLGGERGGLPIEGFDLGNGPHEYTRARVAGKIVALTTTNGTRAIARAAHADHVLVASFWNVGAVVDAALRLALARAEGLPGRVEIVCAGVHGRPCLEDTLCAGAIASSIASRSPVDLSDDQTKIAIAAWAPIIQRKQPLLEALKHSEGGRNLVSVGLADHVPPCAAMNTHTQVPALTGDGMLTVLPESAAARPAHGLV